MLHACAARFDVTENLKNFFPKKFQDSMSHRILQHMHGALNIHENKN